MALYDQRHPRYQPSFHLTKPKSKTDFLALLAVILILFVLIVVIFNALFNSFILRAFYPQELIQNSEVHYYCSACMADIDKNGVVGNGDLTITQLCMNKKISDDDGYGNSCAEADLNGDGVINSEDLTCIQQQFNKLCQ